MRSANTVALVERAVAVGVFQPHDAVRPLLELLFDRVVRAGRFGDVEPALIVERGDDGPLDQRRAGDELDGEAVRHGRRRRGDFRSVGDRRRGDDANGNGKGDGDGLHEVSNEGCAGGSIGR